MRKVGIYVRVSTEEQAQVEEGSIKNQIEALKRYIKAENLKNDDKWGELVEVYADEGFSAKDLKRPAVKRLLNEVDTVLLTEISRLSRSVKDWIDLRSFFQKNDASFIASRQNFDTSNAMGRAMLNFAIEFSQLERELTAERVRASYLARAGRGLYTGGPIPFGLERSEKPGHLQVNAAEQIIADEILDTLINDAGSVARAVEMLREAGRTRKRGREWDEKSLCRWIRNPALIGKIEVNTENRDRDQSRLADPERYKLIDAVWDAVVDESKWKQANDLLDRNYSRLKVDQWTHHEYILTGLLSCPKGVRLVGSSGWGKSGRKFAHYRHQAGKPCDCHIKSLPAPQMEGHVLRELKRLLRSPGMIQALAKQANADAENSQLSYSEAVFAAKRRLDGIERKLARLADKILESTGSGDERIWNEQLARVQREKQAAEGEIAELEVKMRTIRTESLDADRIASALERLTADFESLPIAARQNLLTSLIDRVEILPEEVVIHVKNPGLDLTNQTPEIQKGPRHGGDPLLVQTSKWRERWDSNPRPSP